MKADELRKLNDDELRDRLTEQHKALFELRTQAETEKLERPTEVTRAKREVARILTILGERRRAAETAEGSHQRSAFSIQPDED